VTDLPPDGKVIGSVPVGVQATGVAVAVASVAGGSPAIGLAVECISVGVTDASQAESIMLIKNDIKSNKDKFSFTFSLLEKF
jgi:hypothetical protein